MAIQINIGNGRDTSVAQDLMKITPDPNFFVDAGTQVSSDLDGGTITDRGSGRVGFRSRPNTADPSLPPGTQLLATLTDPMLDGTIVIRGLGSNDNSFAGESITAAAGVTSPIINR